MRWEGSTGKGLPWGTLRSWGQMAAGNRVTWNPWLSQNAGCWLKAPWNPCLQCLHRKLHVHIRTGHKTVNEHLWKEGWGCGKKEGIWKLGSKEITKGKGGREGAERGFWVNGSLVALEYNSVLAWPHFPSPSSCTTSWLGRRDSSRTADQNWSALGRILYNLCPTLKTKPRHNSREEQQSTSSWGCSFPLINSRQFYRQVLSLYREETERD